ncbi:hypothetical protein BDR05DRAFT_1001458 [Suillus weaverae]|nr:hypothetical protein BDR05DRAFT_1001458 [Suillus weaverae]
MQKCLTSSLNSRTHNNLRVVGPTLEDEDKIDVVPGGPSVEAHWKTVADQELKAKFKRMTTLASNDHLFHTALPLALSGK